MQVYTANVIRFPATSALAERKVESQAKTDNVVDFPARSEAQGVDSGAQSHGQMFAAERIVARIAAQLESVAEL